MRITLLRLAAALATFGLGVTLATLWLGLSTPSDLHAYERESCRFGERVTLAPLPPVPPAPAATPAPPAIETLKMETCEPGIRHYYSRTISGGVLNGKAISKPAPKYPAAALAARASGSVVVQITVDECGDVEKANAVSGHPLLREAARQAAYEARFAPGLLGGEPVKVTGTITYNFVLQ
jgi:TonB family protein